MPAATDPTTEQSREHAAAPDHGGEALVELDRAGSLRPTSRDLTRGAAGGLVAGAVFLGVTSWFSTTTGGTPFAPFELIGTLLPGDGTPAQLGGAAIWAGVAIHAVLSLLLGLLFALAAPLLRRRDSLVSAGAAYGGALYLGNYLVFGGEVYPQFEMANQAFGLTTHMLFGALLAATFAVVRLPGESPRNVLGQLPTRIVGALSAAVVASIHFALAGQYLQREVYVGAGFVAGALVLTYTAIQLVRRFDVVAWGLGALTAAGMMAAYVLARTTGLPGNFQEVLVEPDGIVSLVAEAVLILTAIAAVIVRRISD